MGFAAADRPRASGLFFTRSVGGWGSIALSVPGSGLWYDRVTLTRRGNPDGENMLGGSENSCPQSALGTLWRQDFLDTIKLFLF